MQAFVVVMLCAIGFCIDFNFNIFNSIQTGKHHDLFYIKFVRLISVLFTGAFGVTFDNFSERG
jgi:hypothetical protein